MRDVYAASFLLGGPDAKPNPEVVATAAGVVLRWVAKKYDQDPSGDWPAGALEVGADSVVWRSDLVRTGEGRLWSLDWQQNEPGTGIVWQSRCQVGADASGARFTVRIAINSVDARLAPVRYEVGRPNVIPMLAQSPGIHLDGRRMGPLPARASLGGISDLVDLLLDPRRRLPVIVLTPAGETGRGLVDPREVAYRLIGVAHVVEIVDRDATFGLTDRLGPLLSVYGGAVRTYWPGFTLDSNPMAHPLWLPGRIEVVENSDAGVAKRLERQLASVAVMRVQADPLEAELRIAKDAELLDRVTNLQAELERMLSAPGEPDTEWLTELQGAYDTALGLQGQVVTLQHENEDLRRDNEQLRRSFVEYTQSFDVDAASESAAVPEDVTSSSEAIALARKHFANLAIPESAAVSLAELDAANENSGWARSAWRAFRALNAYVEEATSYNGFWDWCERSSTGLWAASEKKLAMSESETVMNSRELREKRRFEVDRRVDPSGRLVMVAHIKVAEGGGQQIPRIYFHDDTKGPTGKVHIGFFGPHRFVPNKGTN
ncbi:MAG: hypothetical protein IVW53_06245 [Chloroflexi bacterium]|nr:hypothetical protein [Chloroflexota bacterium]